MRVISCKRLVLVSFALVIGLSGCASSGGSSGTSGRGGDPNQLTEEALLEHQSLDVYSVIQQLRPRWLTSRGRGTIKVIVDGSPRMDGFQDLRSMRVSDVQEIEYLNAANATTRFGTGYDAGAIMIRTRRR
jgi:hypothetical protein